MGILPGAPVLEDLRRAGAELLPGGSGPQARLPGGDAEQVPERQLLVVAVRLATVRGEAAQRGGDPPRGDHEAVLAQRFPGGRDVLPVTEAGVLDGQRLEAGEDGRRIHGASRSRWLALASRSSR